MEQHLAAVEKISEEGGPEVYEGVNRASPFLEITGWDPFHQSLPPDALHVAFLCEFALKVFPILEKKEVISSPLLRLPRHKQTSQEMDIVGLKFNLHLTIPCIPLLSLPI